jgi:hypothetical protein
MSATRPAPKGTDAVLAPEPPLGPMTDPMAVGHVMARSGLFPDITRVSQAVVKVLAGRELGIGPFAAMSDIHIIDGKPVVGARILAALVRQSPIYDYAVVEWTNERCAIDFYRHGQKLEPTVTFTEDDAQRAGLDRPTRSGKPSNHMKFPRNMKFARAMSNGVGLHCPDLTAGTPVYTPDELEVEDPDADVAPEAEGEAVQESDARVDEPEDPLAREAELEALADAARQVDVTPNTVLALCRFYYDQGQVERLTKIHAAEMADRLRCAASVGLDDASLRCLAERGLAAPDRASAARAADAWLTARRPDPGATARQR